MPDSLRAVYYINQFYAGIGGEDKANTGLEVFEGKKGPAMGVEGNLKGALKVVKTIACGDNFINNDVNFEAVKPQIERIIKEESPHVFIAGPAFNAGRYGTACAKICEYVKTELGIPAVTAMYFENPAVPMFGKNIHIVSTAETASGMGQALPKLAQLALKLAKGEEIGPARIEGYLPTGKRYNEYHEKTGAQRTVEALVKKLRGEEFISEVPFREYEKVKAAEAIKDLGKVELALITTGGLVPKGNPDKLRQAFSVTFKKYSMENVTRLPKGKYESIHGGYDTTFINDDPHRLVPLDVILEMEEKGIIGGFYRQFYTTCGIGTNVENGKRIGAEIAQDLRKNEISAALLTST